MENDISSADSAILAANDLEFRQEDDEIFVSLINGKSVTGKEIRRTDGVYDTKLAPNKILRERERERKSLFDPVDHVPESRNTSSVR